METLRFLQIEPTTRCNYTCGFCAGRAMPQEDIGFEAFQRTLENFSDLGHLELQGEGESLMHPRFFDMIALARGRGVKVSFITNGSYLTPEVNEKLCDVGIEKISVSLESADEETFREIRGGKLSKVIRGIEGLLEARRRRGLDRPIVGFSITVLRRTRDHLPAIIALYRRLGLDGGLTLQPLERKADYASGYDAEMAKETLSDEEVERVWIQFLADREIRKIKAERPPVAGFYDELMEGWRPGKRFCPWLERGMYVNREGYATPCCMVKDTKRHALGKIGVDAPEKILSNRKKLRDELARGVVPEACAGCELGRYSVIGKGELLSLGVRGLWKRLVG